MPGAALERTLAGVKELKVSELFASIQGEGASAGEPAVFLRLAVCNLDCAWCDTPYTWDWNRYDYETEVQERGIGDVAAEILSFRRPRLIVTGGEPLLQQLPLARLFERLPRELVIEVETNGTLAPSHELTARVDQWNVSPKLANAQIPKHRRLRPTPLEALRDTGRAWLKLVIEDEDLDEARALVASLAWPAQRVLLMPQARTRLELAERSAAVRAACDASGFGFSPRLHIERWDGRRGV